MAVGGTQLKLDAHRQMNASGAHGKFYDLTPAMVGEAVAIARLAVIVLASVVAKVLYIDLYLPGRQDLLPYLTVGIVLALLTQLVFSLSPLPRRRDADRLGARLARTAMGLTLSFLLLIAVGYLLKIAHDYSRGWMLTWYMSALGGTALVEAGGAALRRRLTRRGYFTRRVAVYGGGPTVAQLVGRLERDEGGVSVVGVFDDPSEPGAQPHGGGLRQLVEACREARIDDVILVGMTGEGAREVLAALTQLPVNIQLASELISFDLETPRLLRRGDANLIEIHARPLAGWSPWTKAVLDYLLGTLFLILLAPLLAVVAAAIKLDSPGPVLFRQRRHGFNNQEIDVIKFRTMYAADCDDGDGPVRQATRNDERVTRVGRFLRATSIDELPQLINVLRGEMSITGPRPHAVEHNVEYGARIERYASRHKIKPGITGWAQVNGYRGETEVPEKMQKRIEYDIYYIENWSLAFDLRIIFLETLPALLRRQNAY